MSERSTLEPVVPPAVAPRRTRVLLLIKGLGRGGAEQLVVNAVEHGDASRFDYHVAYLLPHKEALVPDLQALGIPVVCLDGSRGATWVVRLRRLVRDRRIDLVHVHSPLVAAFARAGLLGDGRTLVTTEHNVWERYHRSTYWANALTFPRNDHVFAVSDEVHRSIRYPTALGFLPTPPVETLHHGIDLDRVRATPAPDGIREGLSVDGDAFLVSTVANFKPHKGYEYLLEVVGHVVARRPSARFVFVGHGPLQDRMRAQAGRLGLAGAVVFAGFRDDALRVVRASDAYAMASVHEGLPLALLEAMALGRPPVATRVGGVTQVIEDGVSGFLVDPRDPNTEADRIVELMDSPALRERVGAAAAERASRFDVRRAVGRIEQVYGELIA